MVVEYLRDRIRVENPSSCPHCHKGIEPREVVNHAYMDIIYAIFICTYKECKRPFVAEYRIFPNKDTVFTRFLDGISAQPDWPLTIINLDSKFINTYTQASEAERLGLDEISGMGYRKAIEYLIKDYIVSKDNSLKGKVEDALLGNIINEYFNNPRELELKEILKRATWLGNDMTHYLKYHINFDINDLKNLIQLAVTEIHSIEQKIYYINNIQSKYNKP